MLTREELLENFDKAQKNAVFHLVGLAIAAKSLDMDQSEESFFQVACDVLKEASEVKRIYESATTSE